ncbi:hypothetical protein N2152v2_010680 [Parachlorella kessleri]
MATDPVNINTGVVIFAVLGGVAALVVLVVVLSYLWLRHYGAQESSQQPSQQAAQQLSKRQAGQDKGPIVRMAVVVVGPNGEIDLGASDAAAYPSSRPNSITDVEAQTGEGSTSGGPGRGNIDGAWGCELVPGAGKRGPARS